MPAVICRFFPVLACADPITFGLQPVQGSAFPVLSGGVPAVDREAEGGDQVGAVSGGGVAVFPGLGTVQGCLHG